MKGLIIHSNWLDLILSGQKIWELRSRQTNIRGEIALIRKGTGHVCGVAHVTNVIGPLSEGELIASSDRHCVPPSYWAPFEEFKWRYAWVLTDVWALPTPVPYNHRAGAVIWVELDVQCTTAIRSRTSVAERHAELGSAPTGESNDRYRNSSSVDSQAFRVIELSQGNLNNYHFYLRPVQDWLPADVIGGANKASRAARNMTIHWGGAEPAETDVAGDKMIFRSRGWIGEFFHRNTLKAGDTIRVERVDDYEWRLTSGHQDSVVGTIQS